MAVQFSVIHVYTMSICVYARGVIAIVSASGDPIAEGFGMFKGGPSLTQELLEERRWELEKEERGLSTPEPQP